MATEQPHVLDFLSHQAIHNHRMARPMDLQAHEMLLRVALGKAQEAVAMPKADVQVQAATSAAKPLRKVQCLAEAQRLAR